MNSSARKFTFIFIVLFSLANVAAMAANESAGVATDARTIYVSGEGKVQRAPDTATISSGVVTQGKTAAAALTANTQAMQNIMALLREQGVENKDIQTSQFSVQPEYKYAKNNTQPPKIIGYRVSNNLSARIRNLDSVGAVLDALVSAGSNQIGGISFGLSDTEEAKNEARIRAMQNARERAELYAQTAGIKVGEVLSISEQSIRIPNPVRYQQRSLAMAASESMEVPVAAGEQSISASINVLFAIKQ